MDVKTAIDAANADALRGLLSKDPGQSDNLIRWGNCLTHPLHYISDMVFAGTVAKGTELPLVDVLIEAGADVNFNKGGASETPLIGAASLGAQNIALRLLDAGADPQLLGMFGETALHWAALLGEERLVARLAPLSNLDLRDGKYDSPPIGWAIHGLADPPVGDHGQQRQVIFDLLAAGASVDSAWVRDPKVAADPDLLAAMKSARRRSI